MTNHFPNEQDAQRNKEQRDRVTKRSCLMAEEMCKKIKEVVYKYEGDIPLALAIGVLEIVKKEILEESK